MNSNNPSENTLNLLLKYEVGGGKAYYDKYLSKFTWPGGASGPTIGIGIDCAYYTKTELANIFKFLPENEIKLLQGSVGKTGENGKEYTKVLRNHGIVVSWAESFKVFKTITWTKFSNLTEKTFPGVKELNDDAYGAIVSLVFNRGTSLKGPSRSEMRKIKELIPNKDYISIANQFRKMKRLWVGKGLDGLLERRDSEADLIEKCA